MYKQPLDTFSKWLYWRGYNETVYRFFNEWSWTHHLPPSDSQTDIYQHKTRSRRPPINVSVRLELWVQPKQVEVSCSVSLLYLCRYYAFWADALLTGYQQHGLNRRMKVIHIKTYREGNWKANIDANIPVYLSIIIICYNVATREH